MKTLIFSLLLLFSFAGSSQQMHGYNRVYIIYAPQHYFNSYNLDYDGRFPGPLHTKNTLGHYLGLGIERVTHYGLIANFSVLLGSRTHDVEIIRDLKDFDSDARIDLTGVTYRNKIKSSLPYLSPRLEIGYRKELFRDWAILFKIATSFKLHLTHGHHENEQLWIEYRLDSNVSFSRQSAFLAYQTHLGDDKKHEPAFDNKSHAYHLYVGIEHTVNRGWIKSFAAGIECSRAKSWYGSSFIITATKAAWLSNTITEDYYYDRNISVGLRVAVGLWR